MVYWGCWCVEFTEADVEPECGCLQSEGGDVVVIVPRVLRWVIRGLLMSSLIGPATESVSLFEIPTISCWTLDDSEATKKEDEDEDEEGEEEVEEEKEEGEGDVDEEVEEEDGGEVRRRGR